MTINQLHIDGFGKFEDYSLDLTDGFNIIYGSNEDGKSTLMAFIRLMFYPADGSKRTVSDNRRVKYQPWSGAVMGGSVTFTDKGKQYRLERVFGATPSADKVSVWDVAAGKAVKLPAKTDAGKHFFGIDADTFEKSVFLGETGAFAADKSGSQEICSRLQNLVSTGESDVSYKIAEGRIEKALLSLESKSGKNGSIAEARGECDRLENELSEALRGEEELRSLRGGIKEMRAELEETSSQLERMRDSAKALELSKLLSRCDALEKKRGLCAEYLKQTEIGGRHADEEFVIGLRKKLGAAEALEKQTDKLGVASSGDATHTVSDEDIRFLDGRKLLLDSALESQALLESVCRIDSEKKQLEERRAELDIKLIQLNENQSASGDALKLEELEKQLADAQEELKNKRTESSFSMFGEPPKKQRLNYKVIIGIVLMLLSIALTGFSFFFLVVAVFGALMTFFGATDILDEDKRESEAKNQRVRSEMVRIAELNKIIHNLSEQIEKLKESGVPVVDVKAELAAISARGEGIAERLAVLETELLPLRIKMETLYGDDGIPEPHSELERVGAHVSALRDEISARLTAIGASSLANAREQYMQASVLREEIAVAKSNEKLARELEALRGEICEALGETDFAKCSDTLSALEESIRLLATTKTACEAEEAQLNAELDGRTPDELKRELAKLPEPDEKDRSEYDTLSEKYALLRDKIVAAETSADVKPVASAACIEENLSMMRAKMEVLRSEGAALGLASELLRQSFEEMQQSFAPILNSNAVDILSRLTGGRYEQLTVDNNFSVAARTSSGGLHSWEYLSSGTVDQAYFALRLAVAELIGASLPLLLDDVFIQYDDKRTAQAMSFLASRKEQIVLFTCHKSLCSTIPDCNSITLTK